MFYSCAELEGGAQIARSNVLDDDIVEVSIERPIELGFDTAHRTLPAFERSGIEGFTDDGAAYLDTSVHSNAPSVLWLAGETSADHA